MSNRFRVTLWECIFDLGLTVVYAAAAGLAIVAVVASDRGSISILKASVYASLLPAFVIVLIGVDLVLRLLAERRELRHVSSQETNLSFVQARTE